MAFRIARDKMKPESLLDSDPVNIYLTTKPKMPFEIPEEVANGNYGLIINGDSLVGNTELHSVLLLQRTFFLGPTYFREISRLPFQPGVVALPVIPATREAEAGESLNPGGRGCSEPRSHHCMPAWVTELDSVSKKKKEKKRVSYL